MESMTHKIDPLKLYYSEDYYKELSFEKVEFPTMLLLQASSFCNYSCLMCRRKIHVPNRDDTGLGEGNMQLSLIEKLVEQCKGRKKFLGFHFAEYGEPLINPQLVDMIEIIAKAGLKSQIVTNGYLLDDRMIESLIDRGLSKIKVSFQGATKERYRYWRNSEHYDKIVDNIQRLVRIRDERNSDLFIQVGTSSCDDTKQELDDFIKYWSSIVDHAYWNYTALHHLKGDPCLDNVNIIRQAPKKHEKCREVFHRMTIVWNGKVTQCACDEEHFVGDLYRQSILDVWNSDRMNENRRIILTQGNVLPHCDYCADQPKETLPYDYRYK